MWPSGSKCALLTHFYRMCASECVCVLKEIHVHNFFNTGHTGWLTA